MVVLIRSLQEKKEKMAGSPKVAAAEAEYEEVCAHLGPRKLITHLSVTVIDNLAWRIQ